MQACNLWAAPGIHGVHLPNYLEELWVSEYADNTTVVVTTDNSIKDVLSVYDQYERGSRSKLNIGKSKAMCVGKWKDCMDQHHGLNWVKELPLLVAVLSALDYSSATWDPKVEKVEKSLASWKGRSLSFQVKALINTLALSQIWHLCSVFMMPSKVASHVNKAIWSFGRAVVILSPAGAWFSRKPTVV